MVSTFVSVTPLDRDNFQLLDGFDKKLGRLQPFLWGKKPNKKTGVFKEISEEYTAELVAIKTGMFHRKFGHLQLRLWRRKPAF